MDFAGRSNVLLVRYHDGSAHPNWGGRATSLALSGIIDDSPGLFVADTINGLWLTRGFETRLPSELVARSLSLPAEARGRWLLKHVAKQASPDPAPVFDSSPADAALRLLRDRKQTPEFDALAEKIESCDLVVVNGEGDFILSRRASLWRCLILMTIANLMSKPVHLVNTMVSDPTDVDTDPAVADAVGAVLVRAASVSLRDRQSLRLVQQRYPAIPARFAPDALFAWRDAVRAIAASEHPDVFAEGLEPGVRRALERPYVAISGSSLGRTGRDIAGTPARMAALIAQLQLAGHAVVVVATGKGDRWMSNVAAHVGAPFIGPSVPLATGVRVLARATAYLSGRYHPSILAALAGVPCVFMRSNSHKTRSLPELLEMTGHAEHSFFFEDQDVAALVSAVGDAVSTAPGERERLTLVVDRLSMQATELHIPTESRAISS